MTLKGDTAQRMCHVAFLFLYCFAESLYREARVSLMIRKQRKQGGRCVFHTDQMERLR